MMEENKKDGTINAFHQTYLLYITSREQNKLERKLNKGSIV